MSEFTHTLAWQAEGPNYLIALAIGYLLGSIPFGLLLTALLLILMLRVHGNGNAAHLGRMSEQWLAAQRAVRST